MNRFASFVISILIVLMPLAASAGGYMRRSIDWNAWLQNNLNTALNKLGFNSQDWTLVSAVVKPEPTHGHMSAYVQFQNDAGDIINTYYCANSDYSATLQEVCTSDPNMCGMRNTGFRTIYMNQNSKTVGACSAQKPLDSVCPPAPTPSGTNAPSATVTPQPQSCTPSYTCSGSTIIETEADCSTRTLATCVSPLFCSPGSSVCLLGAGFDGGSNGVGNGGNAGSGTLILDGSLTARPSLVSKGERTRLYWNAVNAASCTLTDGLSTLSTSITSGTNGFPSQPLQNKTVFRLHCVGLKGANPATLDADAIVNIIPSFQEI